MQNLHGWQWIFILEAIPTLVFAFVAYFYLPDFPENSKCKLGYKKNVGNFLYIKA